MCRSCSTGAGRADDDDLAGDLAAADSAFDQLRERHARDRPDGAREVDPRRAVVRGRSSQAPTSRSPVRRLSRPATSARRSKSGYCSTTPLESARRLAAAARACARARLPAPPSTAVSPRASDFRSWPARRCGRARPRRTDRGLRRGPSAGELHVVDDRAARPRRAARRPRGHRACAGTASVFPGFERLVVDPDDQQFVRVADRRAAEAGRRRSRSQTASRPPTGGRDAQERGEHGDAQQQRGVGSVAGSVPVAVRWGPYGGHRWASTMIRRFVQRPLGSGAAVRACPTPRPARRG